MHLGRIGTISPKTVAWLLVSVAVIAAMHLSYVFNGFIWLDHGDIEQGRAIIPLVKWQLAFTAPFADTGFFRPLVTLLHSLDAALWAANASGFHITNIVLHCAAAMTAPFFISSFFPLSIRQQCFVAIVFGLHPIGALPAGCISYRSESLLALFTFIAVAVYGTTRSRPTAVRLLFLFIITACACFSKETAFFYLPLFFLVWELFRNFHRNPTFQAKNDEIKKFVLAAGTVAAGLLFVYGLRWSAMPLPWCISSAPMSPLDGIGTRLFVMSKHFLNLLSPFLPPLSDAVSQCNLFSPTALCVVLFIGAVVTLMIKTGFRSPAAITACLCAVCLFPALNIMPLPRFYAPHYAYLAVAPLAAFVVLGAQKFSHLGRPYATGFHVLVVVWITIMGVCTIFAGNRFQTDLTLFSPEIKKDPRFSEGWFYIGNYQRIAGNLSEADSAYNNGLTAAPGIIRFFDPLEFLINKSSIAVRRNDLPTADSLMLIAQSQSPEALQPNIAFIRADIAARRGDYEAAINLLTSSENNLQRPEARRLLDRALSMRRVP